MAWNDYTFTGEGVGMLAVLPLRVCEPWPLVLGDPLLQKVAVTCSLPMLVVVAPPFSQSPHPQPHGPIRGSETGCIQWGTVDFSPRPCPPAQNRANATTFPTIQRPFCADRHHGLRFQRSYTVEMLAGRPTCTRVALGH